MSTTGGGGGRGKGSGMGLVLGGRSACMRRVAALGEFDDLVERDVHLPGLGQQGVDRAR